MILRIGGEKTPSVSFADTSLKEGGLFCWETNGCGILIPTLNQAEAKRTYTSIEEGNSFRQLR